MAAFTNSGTCDDFNLLIEELKAVSDAESMSCGTQHGTAVSAQRY
jgi:hypothetical protein